MLNDVQVTHFIKKFSLWIIKRIGIIDAIDFCAFKDHFTTDFYGTQGSGRVRRKIWISCAGRKYDNSLLFQMSYSSATNIGFREFSHFDCRLDTRVYTFVFQSILKRELATGVPILYRLNADSTVAETLDLAA